MILLHLAQAWSRRLLNVALNGAKQYWGWQENGALHMAYIWLPPGINYHSKGLKLSRWGIFGLPLTHIIKILQKVKSGTSHIMHHTSDITYCIWIGKFYKILVIKIVVPFNSSFKLILKKFVNYFFYYYYRIDNKTMHVKSKISQTNHFMVKQGTFWKVKFSTKI